MKKLTSLFLVMSLLLSIISIPAAAAESKEVKQVSANDSVSSIESKFPTTFDYSTSYTDLLGKEGIIQFTTVEGTTFVEVYVDGILTQRAVSSPSTDVVALIEYNNQSSRVVSHIEPVVQYYKFSDFISTSEVEETTEKMDAGISTLAFSTEGWSYLLNVPSNASITGSKPCTVYSRNYDEEPDLHRYMGKQVQFGVGTAVSIIVSVVASFLTGGVTIGVIVVAFGSAIVADCITSAIKGTICFSTQKIRYAPVISGKNIFPDAYITKRWVITYDMIYKKESFKLDTASYDYNRGQNPRQIAYNAQMAEANS